MPHNILEEALNDAENFDSKSENVQQQFVSYSNNDKG